MTFTHDEIRDRLVDYLYGQLDGDTRAAFLAHLEGCAACREEVSGAERARAVAREVVRRPLGDAVPERVRTRAFEAARAAARASAAPAQKMTAAAAPPAQEGWFTRLRRRWTWTFPTFATVAAMAVFLLVRATIFREAKNPVSEERTRQLANPAAPSPAASSDSEQAGDQRGARLAPDRGAVRDIDGPAAEGALAAPPVGKEPAESRPRPHRRSASARGKSHGDGSSLDGLSSSAPASGAGAGVARPAPAETLLRKMAPPRPEAADDQLDRAVDEPRGRAQLEKSIADRNDQSRVSSAKATLDRESIKAEASERARAAREFATPPPPAAAAPAAAAPAASNAARMAAESPVPAAPAPQDDSKKKAKKGAAPAASESSLQDLSEDRAGAPAPDPALARASRAERLVTERRWAEAITILRDLLRRYPAHPAVPRWRSLLDAAQAGLNAPVAAPPPRR